MARHWPFTARGTAAALLAVVATVAGRLSGIEGLVAFGVLCAALVVVGVVLALLPSAPTEVARATVPLSPAVGDRVVATVGIRRGRWGVRMLRDRYDAGLSAVAVPVEADGALRYGFTARQRGEIGAGPVAVETTDPFGLVVRREVVGDAEPILVGPAVVELDPCPPRADGAGGARPDRYTGGLEDLSARPHAPGDPLRRVHWRATARRGELMVRQEESGAAPEAIVILDRTGWSSVAEIVGLEASFERAVAATASVAVRLGLDGYDVTVVDERGIPLTERLRSDDAGDAKAFSAQLATVTADPGERVALARTADDAIGVVVLVSVDGEGIESLAGGDAATVLVRCGDSPAHEAPARHRVVTAPPSVPLADAWRNGVRA